MIFRGARKRHQSPVTEPVAPGRRIMRKFVSGMVSAAVVASSMIFVGGTITAAPAAAADPFLCTPGAVFVQSSTEIRQFSVTEGGAQGSGGTLGGAGFGTGHSDNGLGISSGGRFAYTVTNSSSNKVLAKYDRATEETTRTPFTLSSAVLRGAVNPVTGVYYFASSTANNAIALYAWNESVSPQTYVQVGTLRPTTGSSAFGANGDMAFSASGQLVLVADQYIYSADLPNTLESSTATIGAKLVHDMGAGVQGNGIAFGNLGHIFVSASGGGNRIIEVDLPRGVTVNSTSLGSFSPTDMSSCTFPNTLSLKKDVPEGRHASTDQFGLSIQSPAGYSVAQTTATTTGDAPGLQPDYAGPVFTNQGDTFALAEAAAGTTDLDGYDASLVCEQINADGSTTPVAVSATNEVVQPAGALGTDVTCTFSNVRLAPGLALTKTADPADGAAVHAGQRITYVVQAENTGNTALEEVEVADDLSGVLAFAEYQNDVITSIDGTEVTSGSATVTGDDLAWSGILQPGQVLTVRYSVIVNDDVEGETIANSVTASGTPPGGEPIVPPAITTQHPVAGFTLIKTADPRSGSVVQPGDVIEYTLTGTNTGETTLAPAAITDDLSGVFAHAQYADDLTTAIDGVELTTGGAMLSGTDLTWTGTLQAGQTVTITYSVTVDDEASGVVLANTASGSATPTTPNPSDPTGAPLTGDPIVPPAVSTEHPVIGSGFTVSKSADPATGTAVDPGSVIEYTVIGTNTGDTVLDPAQISDDLSGVLSAASYNGDVDATRGDAEVADSALSWTGTLAPGQNVVITYSVTIDANAGGETVTNTARGAATPRIPVDPRDPASPTTPGTQIVPPASVTEHRVDEPGFEFSKTVDPASGTAVDPGDVVTYVLTGVNTGETALDPVEIVDDLSGVLADSSLTGDIVATIDGSATSSATIEGDELSWTGALAVGQTVTITYSVTVGADAAGDVLENSATATATPPGGQEITPPVESTSNPVNLPGFSVSKSVSPASGTTVDPGSVITYTVTGVNTGETALAPVEIVDDLTGVLAHADVTVDPVALVDGESADAPVLADGQLTWTGPLQVGQSIVITYSVTVHADAGGDTLENSVTGSATPPGDVPPIETPPAVTVNPVNEPGFELVKTADPASGTRVDPGSVITYTVTGINTGETRLDPVVIGDDLSGVLAHAEYNGDVVATVGGVAVTAPVVQEGELSWQGSLAIGERVDITYSVTVDGDAGGQTIANVAEGSAVGPGGGEITPPSAATEHRVGTPGFSFAKTADVDSQTAVAIGSVLTYTLTGVNTGETDLEGVVITDDLGKVLDHATLTGDVVAMVGDRVVATPVVTGDHMRWTGNLAEGETVTITYAVTVDADAAGVTLENVATAAATGPGGEPLTALEGATAHPVQTPLAITGGQLAPWVLVLALTLLLGGAALLILRRRAAIG